MSYVERVEDKRYSMYMGDYDGKKITLINTGMGAGMTGIVVDQLANQGAKYFFKLGTFGALQDDIEIGDVFIPNGAVRSEGLTDAYAPLYFPAIPDGELFNNVCNKAQELGIWNWKGIIHSTDVYEPYMHNPLNEEKYSPDIYRDKGVIGVEMETSSVFICSYVKNVKSVAVLICNRTWEIIDGYRKDKKVDWDKHKADEKKEKAYDESIKLILESIKEL